ncbi:hypothetical protein ACVIU7_000227 [Bradyrhizobium liaoningense]|nr:hypothetical protein GCM10007858_12170 [Bradyrhizobium liaoningense]
MIGATCAIVTFQMSERAEGPPAESSGPKTLASEPFNATAKVCTRPMTSEATKAPGKEPRPPNTMTTNRIGPSAAAMSDCVTSAGPAMTPARPASALPTPNTTMNTRPTLWPRCPTM